MKYIIILLVGLISIKSFALNCKRNPLYCSIIEINPKLNKKYAFKLSDVIWKTGARYNIDRFLIIAIFAQESMFKLNAQNCSYGIIKKTRKEGMVCTDFGIGQIHYINVKKMNVNIDRLLTDMIYSIDIAIRILYNFKRRYIKREKEWWTRYNSSSPTNRAFYRNKICRFYRGTKYCK